MKINSVAMLGPLLQPVSLYSLPNAPSLVDLDWEETNTPTGNSQPLNSQYVMYVC